LNTDSDKEGNTPKDVPADSHESVHVSTKRRRYVSSSSDSDSEDVFITKKMGKLVPSSSTKEIFYITGDDDDEGLNFAKEKELLEDRNIRK